MFSFNSFFLFSSIQLRFFAVQVLEDTLRNRFNSLSLSQTNLLRQSLWNWLIDSNHWKDDPPYLRNKFAQTLILLFRNFYLSEWQSFFKDILGWVANAENDKSNVEDMFLRICLAIDEEIANPSISRSADIAAHNTLIKDRMRSDAVQSLVQVWFAILQREWNNNTQIAAITLRVISLFINWIDITLIANQDFVAALYQFLAVKDLQYEAVDCLVEMIGKGMKGDEKLSLLQALNLGQLLSTLKANTDVNGREKIAKLINVIGVEVILVYDRGMDKSQMLATVDPWLQNLFPHLTAYLGDEDDDVTNIVLPFLTSLISFYKKKKKLLSFLKESDFRELETLIRILAEKMKFKNDNDVVDETGDDDSEFLKFRKDCDVLLFNIAAIDEDFFSKAIFSMITITLDCAIQNQVMGRMINHGVRWTDLELCLHLLYIYGEAVKGQSKYLMHSSSDNSSIPLSDVLEKLMMSGVVTFNDSPILLLFFEICNRYSTFFEIFPHHIPAVLEAYVDTRGLHHSSLNHRVRCNYLFLKFVRQLRPKLITFTEQVIAQMEDILLIPPLIHKIGVNNTDESSVITRKLLDSQTFLFESLGCLIGVDMIEENQRQKFIDVR